MIRVGIVGCSGYTAIESIKLLLRHPETTIVAATSRQADGSSIADMHPLLHQRLQLSVEDLAPSAIAQRCDVAFCCLPHGASAPIVAGILAAGCKVIDLSADYRLSTPELYQKWYGEPHCDPERLGKTPYGLPELFRDSIRSAPLIANPGCYPTSAILPLVPLVKAGLVDVENMIVDSKSGASGAGRTAKLTNIYSEVNESFSAYAVGNHRHQPEIVDIIGRFTGCWPQVVFTPHLVPMDRGILSTIYVRPKAGVTAKQAFDCLYNFYRDEPFVRVRENLPSTKYVAHSNYCDIAVRENGGHLIILSALDNLIKGAAGAAVQCMNVMFDQPEQLGLGA
ncbi:MAG TPA: N-acetyl-gamma-glutamyl-phosphate reductase [Planctomycetaceae bacterium]|nr:N-acetyl-gamma-glutamyl-phosphate reductase [Planctomycetaceae bacterium]